MEKLKLLNRIDVLYIKSILRSEQANKQAELEQERQEQKKRLKLAYYVLQMDGENIEDIARACGVE